VAEGRHSSFWRGCVVVVVLCCAGLVSSWVRIMVPGLYVYAHLRRCLLVGPQVTAVERFL
jgi:hypothetical protein